MTGEESEQRAVTAVERARKSHQGKIGAVKTGIIIMQSFVNFILYVFKHKE